MVLLGQEKQKLSSQWRCCLGECVWSLIVIRRLITSQWGGSFLDLLSVVLGAALISLTDC